MTGVCTVGQLIEPPDLVARHTTATVSAH